MSKTHVWVSRLTGGSTRILLVFNGQEVPEAETHYMYQHVKVPEGGKKITVNADYSLNVPDQPIIP